MQEILLKSKSSLSCPCGSLVCSRDAKRDRSRRRGMVSAGGSPCAPRSSSDRHWSRLCGAQNAAQQFEGLAGRPPGADVISLQGRRNGHCVGSTGAVKENGQQSGAAVSLMWCCSEHKSTGTVSVMKLAVSTSRRERCLNDNRKRREQPAKTGTGCFADVTDRRGTGP